ncbi:MAG: dNTP triphosphohydrolase [Acidobacteria bacterium]|nr:dNTP triphosphohydrolase [Acidobacteriota bacterium]
MARLLASYAVDAEESRGRRFPEPRHPYRNDFQRDRDRIIHARAFRRLEAKTQVFTRRYSDHFRNRLTHTIEVAQISRTIAAELGLNVDLVEALALAHDIGHPPFGHAGERALDAAMREHGFLFDHNLHALRIVEDFELRYAAFRGLNLTFEVREGIIKHSRDYRAAEFPELSEYLLDHRPPLEAQLIDATDELAYTAADLDDGYEARLLSLDGISEHVPVFARFFRDVRRLYPDSAKKLQFNEVLRRILDRWVTDLIDHTRKQIQAVGTGRDPGTGPVTTGRAQGLAESKPGTVTLEEIRAWPKRLVSLSPEGESERGESKRFLYQNLYLSPALQPEKEHAERVIIELFGFWMKHPERLPASYQGKIESEPRARIVCDYIAGMTDNYISGQYEKYCGKLRVPS